MKIHTLCETKRRDEKKKIIIVYNQNKRTSRPVHDITFQNIRRLFHSNGARKRSSFSRAYSFSLARSLTRSLSLSISHVASAIVASPALACWPWTIAGRRAHIRTPHSQPNGWHPTAVLYIYYGFFFLSDLSVRIFYFSIFQSRITARRRKVLAHNEKNNRDEKEEEHEIYCNSESTISR